MKYNKGEWSEGYAFTKLLGDGKVYAADEALNKISDEYYPILKIIKDEINRYYVRNQQENIIQITDLNGNIKEEILADKFSNVAKEALELIKKGKRTFKVPILENFLKEIEIITLKASCREKADIEMEILDLETDISKDFTFSIKSYLGSKPTVLNASKSTNFKYEIKGISEEEVNKLNAIKGHTWLKDRMNQLVDGSNRKLYTIDFLETTNINFEENLELIDSRFPYLVSMVLLDYYSNKGISNIDELTERLTRENPLELSNNIKTVFYKSKIIELIKAATFGMMPSKIWDNHYTITGGMLTVKNTGEVLCHHIFYDKNSLDEYLYKNTKLETASTTRYNTGKIICENDRYFFTLNLQIRMK